MHSAKVFSIKVVFSLSRVFDYLKFIFSEKATNIEKNLHCRFDIVKCQMDGEDFVNFCGLLRKHERRFKATLFK